MMTKLKLIILSLIALPGAFTISWRTLVIKRDCLQKILDFAIPRNESVFEPYGHSVHNQSANRPGRNDFNKAYRTALSVYSIVFGSGIVAPSNGISL
jgi:hypothetical protein